MDDVQDMEFIAYGKQQDRLLGKVWDAKRWCSSTLYTKANDLPVVL